MGIVEWNRVERGPFGLVARLRGAPTKRWRAINLSRCVAVNAASAHVQAYFGHTNRVCTEQGHGLTLPPVDTYGFHPCGGRFDGGLVRFQARGGLLSQREKSKSRKVSGRVAGGDALAPARLPSLDERYRALEGERDRLRTELEAARAEITRLEAARNDVANRIDWVIDSLHNILESER